MMNPQPEKEHVWLHKLVGDWDFESEGSMGPDQPPVKSKGTETVRLIGRLWAVCEGAAEMPGCAGTMMMTLGYDPQRRKFVGTWVGSMMTNLWVYEGELDPAGRKLSLHAEGPSMSEEGGTARYIDAIEFVSDDHRVMTSTMFGADGKGQQFMTAHYRRRR